MSESCLASPTWIFHAVVVSSSCSRRIVRWGGSSCGRPEKLRQNLWGTKGSPGHQAFQRWVIRDLPWLNNLYMDVSVDSEPVTVDAQQPSALFSPCHKLHLCEEGQLAGALDVLQRLGEQGIAPSVSIYRLLLKECTKRKSLVLAKRVHAHLAEQGLESTSFLGDSVVKTFVKCGSLTDALQVFHRLQQRSVVSWTAVISGYTDAGQGREALRMYHCMQQEGVQPNTYTFVTLLQACGSMSDLEGGRLIHAEAVKHKCLSNPFVGTCLIHMYAMCGSIRDAQLVFEGLLQRNVVTWTAMLAAYTQHGQPEKALQLYVRMWKEGVSPNSRTVIIALQASGACAEKESDVMVEGQSIKVKSMVQTKAVHIDAWKKGYHSDVFVGSTLSSVYGKCGSIIDARNVFEGLPHEDAVPWNSMLAAYIHLEQAEKAFELYDLMLRETVHPNERTFVSVLQACGMMAEKDRSVAGDIRFNSIELLMKGKALHAHAQVTGFDSDVFVGNTLIGMYAKCGSMLDARHVFDELLQRNVVSWNAMLAACAQQGQAALALELYMQMHEEFVSPNDGTSVSVLQAIAMLAEKEKDAVDVVDVVDVVNVRSPKTMYLQMGKAVHAAAQRKALVSDVFVASTLVSMYGKCGSLADAEAVFTGLSYRDVVSWNGMLVAYVQHGQPEKVLQLYEEMLQVAMSPDGRTFMSTFQACSLLAEKEADVDVDPHSNKAKYLEKGRTLHADAQRKGYGSDVFVGNSLITMYGKCGSLLDAQNVFDGLSQHDVVSWTAILAAHARQGGTQKALQLYKQMQEEGVSPNEITLICILQMCSNTGSLDACREIHLILVSDGSALSLVALTTLVHAYGKCASMVDAQAVFDTLPQPDVVSWTALIAGYSREGNCLASLQCYEKMQQAGPKPEGATFLSLLSACSHAGLVGKGVEYFESMSKDYGIAPDIEHYVAMVDLLGRAGLFNRVSALLSTMPMQPNLAIWLCLLGACQKYGKVVLGKQAFDSAVSLQPKDGAAYALMSHIYADAGMLDSANEMDELRQKACAWKKPGESWIRHHQDIHTFMAADPNHFQLQELCQLLVKVNAVLKEGGA